MCGGGVAGYCRARPSVYWREQAWTALKTGCSKMKLLSQDFPEGILRDNMFRGGRRLATTGRATEELWTEEVRGPDSKCMHIYIYIYIYMHTYIHIHTYIYMHTYIHI